MSRRSRHGALAVVCSTGGAVLAGALADPATAAQIRLVVTDRACGALDVAARHDVPAVHMPWTDRTTWSAALSVLLAGHGCDDAVLFFTRLLDPPPPPQRTWNFHPSLLPAFPGLHGFGDALTAGADVVGSTVHLIDEDLDTGPVLFQDTLAVQPADRLEPTALRHRLYLLQVEQLRRLAVHVRSAQPAR